MKRNVVKKNRATGLAHVVMVLATTLVAGCVSARVTPTTSVENVVAAADTSVMVFLLERDLPPQFERLGVVSIGANGRLSAGNEVQKQLLKKCRELGANGAIRINEGTYHPYQVSYLVFRYPRP